MYTLRGKGAPRSGMKLNPSIHKKDIKSLKKSLMLNGKGSGDLRERPHPATFPTRKKELKLKQ